MKQRPAIIQLAALFLVLIFGCWVPVSFDLTTDQRYSLSSLALEELEAVEQDIKIDVFLAGKLPAEFQRLRAELETVLDNMHRQNNKIYIEFIDPFDSEQSRNEVLEDMRGFGLLPETVVAGNNQSVDQTFVFPWAIVSNGNQSVRVSLWQKNIGDTPRDKLFRSLSQLEFQLIDGIKRLTLKEKKNLAVLTSHKTSDAVLIADLLQSLKPYYNLASFDLKALSDNPAKTLENLNRFDLLFVSNPKTTFSNREKFILDQYQMQGGHTLWTIDALALDRDSLFNRTGRAITFPKSIAMDDYFFKQGLRLTNGLLFDLYCAPIVMAKGENEQTQYLPFPWPYYPIPTTEESHPISKGVGNVLFQFTTPIDTLANGLKKKLLATSSPLNKILGVPVIIELSEATKKKNPDDYKGTKQPLAVLVEGQFESLFKNRIPPFDVAQQIKEGMSKTVFISDGNFAESQLDQGQPLQLGYDKWTNNFYQNKRFLQNAIHYLMGNTSLVQLRSRPIEIPLLDGQKVESKRSFIQLLAVVLPLLLLLGLALLQKGIRKLKNS